MYIFGRYRKFLYSENLRISARSAYFKFRRRRVALIRGGRLFEGGRLFHFFQIVAWHDHFSDTSSSINTKISSLLTKSNPTLVSTPKLSHHTQFCSFLRHCSYASQCSKRDITSTQSRSSCRRFVTRWRQSSGKSWRTWSNVECRWLAPNLSMPYSYHELIL